MKKKIALRLLSAVVSMVIVISAVSGILPQLYISAQTDKTQLTPLLPFKTFSIGGTDTEKTEGKGVFNDSEVGVISSKNELKGILADRVEPPEADASLGVVVTPLAGGVKVGYNYATVNSEFVKTTSLSDEKGVKITTVSGVYTAPENDLSKSQAYAAVQYPVRNGALGMDGVMFYLKLDSANTVLPDFTTHFPENPNRWQHSWNPVFTIGVGLEYSYMPLGESSWTTAKAIVGKPGNNTYFGAMRFDSAFEGYVKIPFNSLVNDMKFAFKKAEDSFYQLTIHAGTLGGKYGTMTAGPFYCIDTDSSKAKITLNPNPPAEAPKDVGIKLSDFEVPMKDAKAMLLYVKTDSANRISLKAGFEDEYLGNVPRYQLSDKADVYLLEKGSSKWVNKKTVYSVREGMIVLDKAFEGYIKIPMESFIEEESKPPIAVLPEYSVIKSVEIGVAGVGGKYGKVQTVPFIVTKDTGSTKFELTEGYISPEIQTQLVVPVEDTQLLKYNTAYVTHTDVKPLPEMTEAMATKLGSATGNLYEHESISASQVYANYQVNNISIDGYNGVVFYVKTEAANEFCPQIEFVNPGDTSRWKYSYAPIMVWKTGVIYEYLPKGETEWKSGTTTAGVKGNTYFAVAKFDKAFEGFIRVPFSSLSNDSGFAISPEKDKIKNIVYKLRGIGGEYKGAILGPTFLMKNETGVGIEVYKPAAETQKVTAVKGGELQKFNTATVTHTELAPLDFTDVKGTSMGSASASGYENANLNASQVYANFDFASHKIEDYSGVIAYVKLEAGNTFCPQIEIDKPTDKSRWKYSWTPIMVWLANKSFEYLPIGETEWKTGTTVQGVSGNSYFGSAKFDEAFEGYIKIPFSSLYNDSGFTLIPELDTVDRIVYKLKGIGGKYKSAILGPSFFMLNDGEGFEYIEDPSSLVPEGPSGPVGEEPEDVYEKIQWIFENSKAGNMQGYYFMVGDSTRHELGYPVFRIVRHELMERYNMICDVQALSGLKTEHWSGYTPGLQGSNPTVEQLINKIPGTGQGCIVDIALGINDSAKGADKLTEFLKLGIDKIRAAKPDVVITYTSPNIVSEESWNKSMRGAAANIWSDKSIFAIDVHGGVMADFYAQYYRDGDTVHPNVKGYRLMAKYILSKYFGGPEFEKIVVEDKYSKNITVPSGATLLDSELTVSKKYNLSAIKASYTTDKGKTNAFVIEGLNEYTGKTPFNTSNFVETKLSKDLIGYDYIAFHIDLPKANRIGVTAFTNDGTKENIFKNYSKFYVMADGSSDWKMMKATAGRQDGSETYGSLQFDSAFSGWVKLPLSGFYGSPTNAENINKVTMRFSELGGNYGQLKLGAFLGIKDEPYVAKNVWKKSDLPEMTPFTPITKFTTHTELSHKVIPSPIPSLTSNNSMLISSSIGVDKESYLHYYWATNYYNNMPIGNFSHLMFYVKVPEAKENLLTICLFTDTKYEFKMMANTEYALLSLGSNEWEHYLHEKYKNSWGGIKLPAGFEGFIKVPIASLLPAARVKADTVLSELVYRFSYIGSEDEAVLIGPAFGVTKDNDKGPKEVVYTSMPEPTTIKSLYALEDSDIFTDSIMVYWEKYDDASGYIMEAYSVTKTDSGFEYRLAASNTAFTNSGTITGLMPNRQYAILIKAVDAMGNVIAVYDYTLVKTANEETLKSPILNDKMSYDKVYYPVSEITQNPSSNGVNVLLIVGIAAGALLAVAAVVIIIIAVKRRKRNA